MWNSSKFLMVVFAVILVLAAGACAAQPATPVAPTTPSVPSTPSAPPAAPALPPPVPPAPPAVPPTISIVSPADGSFVSAGAVTVKVQVSNFNLVSKLGTAPVAGEGHIHYFLDADAPTTPDKPAVTAAGTYAATADTTYTWQNVAAGKHILSVELIQNNHTPLQPPAVATISVTAGTLGGY